MHAFAYVGNAIDGAGFRLVGARCWVPFPGEERACFEAARRDAEALFLATEVAERLPRSELDGALAASRPLIVLVPRPGEEPGLIDPAERARVQLGLER